MPHVRRICALVDGLPLGIELAAAWVRTIPCAEIAQELERGADALPAAQRNRPVRQQTLRAVVEFSWRLLTPEQQDVLAALAQCHGGFSREAAEHVAQASLRTLSSLVDKALVRRGPDSRFSLHPLVRRFAAEKLALAPARAARARTRHADHYLRLLCAQLGALNGLRHLESRMRIEDDLDNIRAAWAAKLDERDVEALGAAARPMALAFDRLGLYDEWTRTFERAVDALPSVEGAAARRLLLNAANGYWRQGDVARAEACRRRLEPGIAASSDPAELAEYHKLAGLVARDAGDNEDARRHFERASALAVHSADRLLQAHIANELGVVHWREGAIDRARVAFVDSLAQCEAAGDVFDVPLALHNIGYCDIELGRFEDADRQLQRALAMFRERGHARGETMVLASLGILARRRGDLAQAEAFGRASLALAERIGNALAIADTLDDLGQVLEQRGALDEAVALFDRALAMARTLGQAHLQCFVLLHRARDGTARRGEAACDRGRCGRIADGRPVVPGRRGGRWRQRRRPRRGSGERALGRDRVGERAGGGRGARGGDGLRRRVVRRDDPGRRLSTRGRAKRRAPGPPSSRRTFGARVIGPLPPHAVPPR
jgi:tetratricopeptide (TPR) repeat protein